MVIGAALGEHVHRRCVAVVCCHLLELGFVVAAPGSDCGRPDSLVERCEHKGSDRLDPAIEVHRAKYGLDRIGEDRGLLSAPRRILTLAEPQLEPDAELPPHVGEGWGRHHRSPGFGELSFGQVRESFVQVVGYD